MPPQIALFLSLGFSIVLVWRELKQHPEVSKAVWIPCLWLLILGSRSVSQWLNLSPPVDADVLMDGSPTDRMVFTLLMVSALVVLWSRRVAWTKVVTAHPWLILFFVYCALSVVWSDFPGVALKRWFKSLGDPLMVLVLLSETSPAAAVTSVLRRCAFILVPLSIVFIKYFPHLGRAHDLWSGAQFYTGVTTNKNMLGYLLLVFGLYFICALITKARSDTDVALKDATARRHCDSRNVPSDDRLPFSDGRQRDTASCAVCSVRRCCRPCATTSTSTLRRFCIHRIGPGRRVPVAFWRRRFRD